MVQTWEYWCRTVTHLYSGRMENQISYPDPAGVLQQSGLCMLYWCASINNSSFQSSPTYLALQLRGWFKGNLSSLCFCSKWSGFSLLYNGAERKCTSCLSFPWERSGPPLLLRLSFWLSKMRHVKTTIPHEIKGPSSLVPDDTWHQMPGEEWKDSTSIWEYFLRSLSVNLKVRISFWDRKCIFLLNGLVRDFFLVFFQSFFEVI